MTIPSTPFPPPASQNDAFCGQCGVPLHGDDRACHRCGGPTLLSSSGPQHGALDDRTRSWSVVEQARWENTKAVLAAVLVAGLVVLVLTAVVLAISRGGAGGRPVELLLPEVRWCG